MKYIYTEKDLDLISWNRIDEFVDKIYNDVKKYLSENNLKIKYIIPILRGGGIPAIMFSHMFDVIEMLPIQLKHNDATNRIDTKIGLDFVKNVDVSVNECVLLVEGNHVTGSTANVAIDLIKQKFGDKVKIIYVSLTRDYTYRDSVRDVCYTSWAMSTNEMKELSEDECKKLNINYSLVSVYPWENVDEELKALNAELGTKLGDVH